MLFSMKYNEPHSKHEQAGCALSILHHMKNKTKQQQQQKITTILLNTY